MYFIFYKHLNEKSAFFLIALLNKWGSMIPYLNMRVIWWKPILLKHTSICFLHARHVH